MKLSRTGAGFGDALPLVATAAFFFLESLPVQVGKRTGRCDISFPEGHIQLGFERIVIDIKLTGVPGGLSDIASDG